MTVTRDVYESADVYVSVMPKHVLSIRVDDASRAYLEERATASGRTLSAEAADLVAPPSFSTALDTISVVRDHGGIDQVLALADDPRLADVTRSSLRDLGQQILALAKRWPR